MNKIYYANFLRNEQRYEEAVKELSEFLTDRESVESDEYNCHMSCIVRDIWDIYTKIFLCDREDTSNSPVFYGYLWLFLTYQEAGVFAEVYLPEYHVQCYGIPDKQPKDVDAMHSVVQWVSIFISCGQDLPAFQVIKNNQICFSTNPGNFVIMKNFVWFCIATYITKSLSYATE